MDINFGNPTALPDSPGNGATPMGDVGFPTRSGTDDSCVTVHAGDRPIPASNAEDVLSQLLASMFGGAPVDRAERWPAGMALLRLAHERGMEDVLASPTVKAALRRVEIATHCALERRYSEEVRSRVAQNHSLTQPSIEVLDKLRASAPAGFWQSMKRLYSGNHEKTLFKLDSHANEIEKYIEVHDETAFELDESVTPTDSATIAVSDIPHFKLIGFFDRAGTPEPGTRIVRGLRWLGPGLLLCDLRNAVGRADRAVLRCCNLVWPAGMRHSMRKLLETAYISPIAMANLRF